MAATTDDVLDAWGVRHLVYARLAATGTAPSRTEIDDRTGGRAAALLGELHERHALVVGGDGEVRMALPFSAVPTPHRVTSGPRHWWANCAWDALAIPLVLDVDAEIDSEWADSGEPLRLAVRDGALPDDPLVDAGAVQFPWPAARWWDDIVET